MKTFIIFFTIFVLGTTCLYFFISISNFNLSETNPKKQGKPINVTTKKYPTYYDDNLHDEWPFMISKTYEKWDLYQWKEPNEKTFNSLGIGENGIGFVASDEMKELMEKMYKENNYNLYASEMMSLHRSLPDSRNDECKILSYPERLPKASVIIIFHNEAWTTLLRTVWSIIDRSPIELIQEIILVDDMSTGSFLKRPLDDYLELLPVHITVIRTMKREGLIRARLLGAKRATGRVLIFLDAHMECVKGWIEPLLSRIANDRSVIAVPLIDSISSDNLQYQANEETFINGFSWDLSFDWMSVPDRERARTHNDKAAPFKTPTLIGCGFSVDREFFFEIGSYDAGMDIWGSENMEMSLRVWQCGGSMELIPCSHIGHLYRQSTYSFDGNRNDITAKNSVRLVEVWMSDMKNIYYAAIPAHKNVSAGDLTERFVIKKRLKCKSFRWFLENVYPESNMQMEFTQFVEIKSVSENKCADIHHGNDDNKFTLLDCHGMGGNQMFAFAKNQMIATQNSQQCVGVSKELDGVLAVKCVNQQSQWWRFDQEKGWIIHIGSGYCMKANHTVIDLRPCDPYDDNFKFDLNSIL